MKKLPGLALFLAGILLLTLHARAQQFVVDTLAQRPDIVHPACLAFASGGKGKLIFTEKDSGWVRLFENGTVQSSPFAVLAITSSIEQGLLGVDVHPGYPDSPYVYVQYTRAGDRANVVVRFRDSSGIGVDPRTIAVCPRNNALTVHNGGNCHFGPDGKLYVSFGDNGTQSNAQDSSATNVSGKILRLNPDGSIPTDNPFPGKPFWSIGHRNSVDFTWDSQTGRMYCTENGAVCDDEVNFVPAGGNLGWPVDGNCAYTNNPAYVRPLFFFSSNLPGLSGISIYRATAFPRLRGRIILTGSDIGAIWTLALTAAGDSVEPGSLSELFKSGTALSDIEIGPDGDLYVTSVSVSSDKLLRFRPVAPVFTTGPPDSAVQGVPYSYTPAFNGTPPGLALLACPDGMTVDSVTWSIYWTPTNSQAIQRTQRVQLRAENGGGFADQSFTIAVRNVNDPPGAFNLTSPASDTTLVFNAPPLAVFCTWTQSFDPDLDSVYYSVQFDTTALFNSPALIDTQAGTNLAVRVQLPRQARDYYWRVKATDGLLTTCSSQARHLVVALAAAGEPRQTKEDPKAVLGQNFPNPFNPTTVIHYTIPQGGRVRLAVYNLLGQEVSLVFEGTQSAGTYEFTFSKEDLPTGIYFYRIQAPGFVETRKMVITK